MARRVVGFDGAPVLVLLGQVAVDGVLDHGQAMLRSELRQAAALALRHAGAQRIAERGHDQQGLHGLRLQCQLQGIERNAMPGVRGNFQCLEVQALQHLQKREMRGRLQCDHIPRLRHRAQAQADAVHAAAGDENALRVQAAPQPHRIARNGTPGILIPVR